MDSTLDSFSLVGNRVMLRNWTDADLEPFVEMNTDPVVRKYFPKTHTRDESCAEFRLIREHGEREGFTFWPIEHPGVTKFAGFVGLIRPRWAAHFMPCIDIGWRLLPRYWGKGYATEGANLSLKYAFEALRVPEVVALTTITNTPSRKVMERLGMQTTANDDFENPLYPDGHALRPHVLYRLKQEQWRSKRSDAS